MKLIGKIFKWLFSGILLFLVYLIGCIVQGTTTDFQPEEVLPIRIAKKADRPVIDKAKLSFLNWNIGYAGLGGSSNFFYDAGHFFFSGGKMVRSSETLVNQYLDGIKSFIAAHPADFVLLQEVDKDSKRSYYTNEYEAIHAKLPTHNKTFATNFLVERVPIPIAEPWNVIGQANSGLATYSYYTPKEANRYQFPGEYNWPNHIFHLDRCMAVHRYPTTHPEGKELVVINTHNSAYDGGKLKKQEMAYFKKYVLAEYAKGNYVVVGGDWNQCPPGEPFDKVALDAGISSDTTYDSGNIAADFLPEGWQWAYDPTVATNRKMDDKLDYGKTFMTIVDYYLVSPNVELTKVEGKNLKFAYSDHNPVWLEVELKGMELETDTINNTNL